MTDAEKVLRWLGYTKRAPQHLDAEAWWNANGTLEFFDDEAPRHLDANWITGTLIPALEERLRIKYIGYWPLGNEHDVTIAYADKRPNGRGPTFEAAMLAAAAKAVSGE